MLIKSIQLYNFRNHKKTYAEFSNTINVFIGENGSGKTNLLESLYYLLKIKPRINISDVNLINNESSFFSIKGKIIEKEIQRTLEVKFINNVRNLFIDNIKINKTIEYTKQNKIVSFFPDDLEIIKGSPFIRRSYIDDLIIQLDEKYFNIYNNYKKILKIRNLFLKNNINNNNIDIDYLEVINSKFIYNSLEVLKFRRSIIKRINNKIIKLFPLFYNIKTKIVFNSFLNDEEDISFEVMWEKLNSLKNKEIYFGKTLIGPQLDDYLILMDNKKMIEVGSQGQQRTMVLCLKIIEVELISELTDIKPILLLDDVFSELDEKRVEILLKYIETDIQSFITTSFNEENVIKNFKSFFIKKGEIGEVLNV